VGRARAASAATIKTMRLTSEATSRMAFRPFSASDLMLAPFDEPENGVRIALSSPPHCRETVEDGRLDVDEATGRPDDGRATEARPGQLRADGAVGGGGDGDADQGLARCLSRHCDMSLPRIVTATSDRSHRTISSTTRSAWRSGGGPSDAMVGQISLAAALQPRSGAASGTITSLKSSPFPHSALSRLRRITSSRVN
jgi:hypothetical protein